MYCSVLQLPVTSCTPLDTVLHFCKYHSRHALRQCILNNCRRVPVHSRLDMQDSKTCKGGQAPAQWAARSVLGPTPLLSSWLLSLWFYRQSSKEACFYSLSAIITTLLFKHKRIYKYINYLTAKWFVMLPAYGVRVSWHTYLEVTLWSAAHPVKWLGFLHLLCRWLNKNKIVGENTVRNIHHCITFLALGNLNTYAEVYK